MVSLRPSHHLDGDSKKGVVWYRRAFFNGMALEGSGTYLSGRLACVEVAITLV